jgi:hypothetical protein
VQNLTNSAQEKLNQKIAETVFGIVAAFGDHKGKNGVGQPADDPENGILGKKQDAYVIGQHGKRGDQLQGVAAKAREPGRMWNGHKWRSFCFSLL